jgi:hypothetical protein
MLVAVSALTGSVASADSLTGILNLPHDPSLDPYPGPYGTVQINLVSGQDVSVVFTANSGFTFIDGSSVGIALTCGACDNSVYSIANVFASPGNPITDIYLGSPDQVNGVVGSYNAILSQQTANSGNTLVSFDIKCPSCDWLGVHDIINAPDTDNPLNSWIEAHIAVLGTDCGGGSPCTGHVGGAVATPEPGTLTLLGIGFLASGAAARRFKKR